ncbi:MAG: hypothetical protein WC947_04600 [Elusimicrobiota bacterium]
MKKMNEATTPFESFQLPTWQSVRVISVSCNDRRDCFVSLAMTDEIAFPIKSGTLSLNAREYKNLIINYIGIQRISESKPGYFSWNYSRFSSWFRDSIKFMYRDFQIDSLMRAIKIIVGDVFTNEPVKMFNAENRNFVEKFGFEGLKESFNFTIGQRITVRTT